MIYVVSEPGPFAVGDHTIVIRSGNTTVCSSTLHVTDTVDPLFVTHTVELWPPNHQMHTVTAADCVTVHDACDGDVPAYFTFAAVDEPADMNGSANTEIDMANLTCNAVDVRVERSGTGDGRVYTLGWAAEDAAGHRVEGTCQVVVPHDQGGKGDAVAGAEVKRIDGPVECLPRRD